MPKNKTDADVILNLRLEMLSGAVGNMKGILSHGIPEDPQEIKQYLRLLDRISGSLENLKAGYNPAQPRVPRGNSRGGEWRGGGRTSGPHRNPQPMPSTPSGLRKPGVLDGLFGVKPARAEGIPGDDDDGVLEGRPGVPGGFGGAGGRGGAGIGQRNNTESLKEYLKEARKIPQGVVETGRSAENLASGQKKSLKGFIKKHSKFKKNIEVIQYSDGRVIYSVKQPAENIPGSYTVWEKHVDAAGNTIKVNKTTVDPDGRLVHIKPY